MHPQPIILIVDDRPTNRLIITEVLGEAYHYLEADSGREALAVALRMPPDIILLDVMMPGMDGYETCRQLRLLPALRHTKILMVSAKAMAAERLEGYEAGADDYITKPFEKDELRAKIRVYLRLKTAEDINALKSQVLTFLTHTTCTPLQNILSLLSLLHNPEDLDPAERADFIACTERNIHNLTALCKQVGVLSAMQAGQWEFDWLTIDLRAVVQSALLDLKHRLTKSPGAMTILLPDKDVNASVDPQQYRELLCLLLEYILWGGAAEENIWIRLVQHSDQNVLEVTAQDWSIPAEILPQLFHPFVDTIYHAEGWGLRLALVQAIVQAHQGAILVRSTSGGGTTFLISLPLSEPGANSPREEPVWEAVLTCVENLPTLPSTSTQP